MSILYLAEKIPFVLIEVIHEFAFGTYRQRNDLVIKQLELRNHQLCGPKCRFQFVDYDKGVYIFRPTTRACAGKDGLCRNVVEELRARSNVLSCYFHKYCHSCVRKRKNYSEWKHYHSTCENVYDEFRVVV